MNYLFYLILFILRNPTIAISKFIDIKELVTEILELAFGKIEDKEIKN